MKNILLVILVNLMALNIYAQKKYFVELNYENFVGDYYHEGGVSMRITYDGTVFTIYDILYLGDDVNEKIERVFIGYPYEGMIRYQVGGKDKFIDGPNKYEYMKFSLDFENELLVGYYGYSYRKAGYKLRTKEIGRSDLEFLSYYVGIWSGTSYGGYKYKCKIYFDDGKMYFQNLVNNRSCELQLTQGRKLYGQISYENFQETFELYFDDTDNLISSSYDSTITYTEVESLE
ncbi:MAG: hypothetical protein R2730_07730 [Chitinophagales bacterium]|nr:hypothetical protein [Bacteroidota bacterium]